jgi:hypothetical protein
MIVTTENFWCPQCGHLPLNEGHMEVAAGHIGGWTSLTCRRCGSTGGDIVCDGDTDACRLWSDGWCSFHANYTGPNPHPFGLEASRERQKRELEA